MRAIANFRGSMAMWTHARGRNERALAAYAKAYETGMDAPMPLCSYGLLLAQNGKAREAIPVLKSALKSQRKLKPKDRARAYNNLGIAFWKAGDIDNAVKAMRRVFDLQPTAATYGTLGYFLIEQGDKHGDYDEALAFNRTAYEYDEGDPVILDNLAQVYVRRAEYAEAIPLLRAALAKKPGQVDSIYYLAMSLLETGEVGEARVQIDRALEAEFKAMSTVTRAQAEALKKRIEAAEADGGEDAAGDE